MKQLLIHALRGLHNLILLFVLLGWLIPSDSVRLVHLIFLPLMVVQWKLNQNTCYLTNIEYWLKGAAVPKKEQDSQFIRSVIARFTDWKPERKHLDRIIYGTVLGCWCLSAVFYFLF